MQLYIIQYPSMYPNGCSSQRLIVANNNLVRSVLTDDERGEKTKKNKIANAYSRGGVPQTCLAPKREDYK